MVDHRDLVYTLVPIIKTIMNEPSVEEQNRVFTITLADNEKRMRVKGAVGANYVVKNLMNIPSTTDQPVCYSKNVTV